MKTTVLSMLACAIALTWPGAARASGDLIVDGVTTTIADGVYQTVLVKNGGVLTVNGNLEAQQVWVLTRGALNVSSGLHCQLASIDGTLTVGQNLVCASAVIVSGTSQISGAANVVDDLSVSGRLIALGGWQLKSLVISASGVVQVRQNAPALPQSGLLRIAANTVRIDNGGVIDAGGAGNDPRGQGHDWYQASDGGGHGGQGGRGYWNSSAGNEGQAFGSPQTYESFMGGAGGSWGGGGIFIEAEVEFVLNGSILADGMTGVSAYHGGGGGGGILIRSAQVTINGLLSARGGNGVGYSGGGGGGRIKVFYGNDTMPQFPAWVDVSGGTAGGFLNTQPGQPGTVCRDHIPRVSSIALPADGAAVANGSIAFRFLVTDLSESPDGHKDALASLIELSRDGFQTIAYTFDQNADLSGWDRSVYYSGDVVQYTPMVTLAEGVYQWRVSVRDQSLYSRPTAPRSLGIGVTPPVPLPLAGICLTPTVVIIGTPGARCRIDYTDALGEATVWQPLATVVVAGGPQLYFDAAAIDKPRRFYRLSYLP